MQIKNAVASTKAALRVVCLLPFAAALALSQQQVNLTAGPATAALPDGSALPMWGYTCTPLAQGVTSTATCAALNKSTTGWSPVLITVPFGQDLTINLSNNLSFATGNTVPTSLTIVGQLGGGLGSANPSRTKSPDHSNAQGSVTWPIANTKANGTPPTQPDRVQSFSTEVAAGGSAALTWKNLRPGTYLIESGTHPSIQGPMGLYGMLIVTTAPTTTPATDPTAPPVTLPGTAYPGTNYDADVPFLMSEIDPVQNAAVNTAVNTAGFNETAVWSGKQGACGDAGVHNCYPPAVNYTPLYYLFNGVAFDKSNAGASMFSASGPVIPITGQVLVRFVNAGLRMHVPSIVGAVTGTPPAAPVGGFSLIAEDGNPLPGLRRVQSEVFMAAGKTYDVMINAPAAPPLTGTVNVPAPALPVFDRELSLSGNSSNRDSGMLAYLSINNAGLPSAPVIADATANPDSYRVVPGRTLNVSDASKGLLANDVNVFGVKVLTPPTQGTLVLATNGTFTYAPGSTWTTTTTDTFQYQATNGSGKTALVTLTGMAPEAASGITANNITYTSNIATSISIKSPGVLSVAKDAAGYPLTVATSSVAKGTGLLTLSVDSHGGFNATTGGPGSYTFTYQAQNPQGTLSAPATVTLNFLQPSRLNVTVVDGKDKTTAIKDYRWIIEEDRTFYVDPTKTTNTGTSIVPTFGTNFHTSYMPLVAAGCVGTAACESGQTLLGKPAVCDVGDGVCRTDSSQQTPVDPGQVHLDPTKRYYLSVLPGDASDPFSTGNTGPNSGCATTTPPTCKAGHGMGGAPIAAGQTSVTVLTQPTPLPPAKLTVFVYEDDAPLNGEQDAGGGVDILAPNEPGLGGFNITLFDAAGGPGDFTGQLTYDMFNMPLSNSLAGTPDPANHNIDACPISQTSRAGINIVTGSPDTSPTGITGTIVTCPTYEADGKTLSPLAGQAVIANMMPGRYGVVATPAADRIARGEEWLQTNTLDGQKAHDSFLKVGEPAFFQEFGPASFHVAIGFANPAIINGRHTEVCQASTCGNSIQGKVTTERMSRTPDERLYSSGSHDSFSFSQCYVSFGDPDGEDFAFTKCNADGTFKISGLPDGDWRVTTFDQWNDQLVDGLSTPVRLAGGKLVDMGDIAATQWQANLYTRTFFDQNGDGVSQDKEPGLALVATNIRFRDGSFSNFNNTDLNGNANFNEVFPLFNWYVVETDTTRYKSTGTHVVYDAGGPADNSPACGQSGYPACGTSVLANKMANTAEKNSLPANLRVPGSVYCDQADCTGVSIASGPITGGSAGKGGSTGRIDAPWVESLGWQGFSGQNSFLEFGKKPYAEHENGGIHGHVVYASTRPFDDPQLLLQLSWEPLVPHVTINLYQEGTAPDGNQSLTLVDTTQTSSFDDWAQGFRADGVPNMNCPGQTTSDLFYFSLYNQPNYLNVYNSQHGGPAPTTLPYNSQYKCYDGMHNWNQLQPAPYDGMYKFPSVNGLDQTTGKSTGTNCTICIGNPDTTDPYRSGMPMLPAGKYVVEVVVPPGYELVKEEDKNILIGDNFIAPVVQQFAGLGNIFILPDQAAVGAAYNSNNAQNPTQDLGSKTFPRHQGDTGEIETYWPCVGEPRTVPDFISLFPGSAEVAPFAGAWRNLCDRKEVALADQTAALAKFYIFTSTHTSAHFTGVITDDFTAEFDPFSPQFGEKFAPPDLPVSVKDWAGNEVNRVYADHWGTYDGLNYSTWEVNPPNPTGYSPTMMTMCMNDPGSGTTPDPLFNPGYSQFCYELPFMPGQTQYMDTPVTPTSAFSEGYNHPDCSYPNATPAVSEVDGDGFGPYVSAAGNPLTIKALGDQQVINNGYSGPSATAAPFNQKTVTRHYGFGGNPGTVTIGGKTAQITGWSDTQITVKVPSGVPACGIPQQGQPSQAQCGQLVITTADGKQSIDAVTVTIGGSSPTHVGAGASIQAAIDKANPGDLIMLDPGVHKEFLLMWKPIRLQGVGAASSVINANTHPAGKLDPWRRQVNCLFGLALNGQPINSNNPYDPTPGGFTCGGWTGFKGGPNNPQVDRLPLEGILGWDTTVNGNLAQLLQEPTLMGAYEGAGITVLGKGVRFPNGATDIYGSGAESAFPAGTKLLTNSASDCTAYPSNFLCNPSSIDGISVTDSSQGGGGIFVHAWGHNLQIANNRVYNNSGTLTGGITIGQGESPDAYLQGDAGNADPGSCANSSVRNAQLPYCFDVNVNVHNNYVALNSSIGDELYSSTPAGGGGVTFCTGADYYKFQFNWVCGNLSTGDGGGLVHLGYIWNGDIEHNSILFNQSTNPTVPTNGGGLMVMGAPPDGLAVGGLECGNTAADADCTPGLSDGTGPNLTINANLIMGNAAESGSGGGIRLQGVNGTEVVAFPLLGMPIPFLSPGWNSVSITNNIITNNVAGWDGGGISMQDALVANIINNTIVSNDTTASSGVLFNTLGAPIASSQGPTCTTNCGTTSAPQAAGLVSMQHSQVFKTTIPSVIFCPPGHPSCQTVSYPLLYNDVFWQNRSFYIGVGALSSQYQQNVVSLYNSFTTTLAPNQPQAAATQPNGTGTIITGGTGACTPASYWDIGIRGDKGPSDHTSTVTLNPMYSVLTATAGYDPSNTQSNPTVVSQYCNGSRTPPELASGGWQVPPGISDATVPNPIFNLTPSATVDEGNNWINISWGPLALASPVSNKILGSYSLAAGSPAIDYVSQASEFLIPVPSTDFFGNPRPAKPGTKIDVGAVEYVAPANLAVASITGGPLAFGNVAVGTNSAPQTLTLHNDGTANLTFTVAITPPFFRATGTAGGTCAAILTPASSCTINVVFSPTPTATGSQTGTVTITANVPVTGSPVALSGTGAPVNPSATITPNPLAFGNWTTGTTSGAQTLTVTNTGNVALAGGTFTVGSGFKAAAGGTCGPALARGATCTIRVVFAPTTATPYSSSVTATYTNPAVATATLTGTGVTTKATVLIAPNPLTITVQSGVTIVSNTGVVTLTNTQPANGTSMAVTNVAVSGGNILTYFFNAATGTGADTCTGANLAPGASCNVTVRFTNVFSAKGVDRPGTITFADSAGTQTGNLIGHANP